MKYWSTAFLVAAFVAISPITATAQVKLAPKVEPNTQWSLKNTIDTKQTLSIAGMDIQTASKQVLTVSRKAGARAANGNINVENTITDLEAEVSLPGGVEIEYNSKEADKPPTGTQFDVILTIFKAMHGASWTLVHDKDLQVIDVQGQEKVLEGLEESTQAMLKKQFETEYLKEQANTELEKLLPGPVAKGDTWTREVTVRLEAGQNLKFTTEYKYEGIVEQNGKQLDKVSSKTTEVSYSIDDDAPTPLREKGSDLNVSASSGAYLFDRQLGQVVDSHEKVHIKGTINFAISGQELEGKLDLEMNTKTERT